MNQIYNTNMFECVWVCGRPLFFRDMLWPCICCPIQLRKPWQEWMKLRRQRCLLLALPSLVFVGATVLIGPQTSQTILCTNASCSDSSFVHSPEHLWDVCCYDCYMIRKDGAYSWTWWIKRCNSWDCDIAVDTYGTYTNTHDYTLTHVFMFVYTHVH